MNKAFILLLVTLVQSQSDGVVLSKDDFQDSQLEDYDTAGASSPVDVIKDCDPNWQKIYSKRLVTSDAFTRRSALDKNFMRFGRGRAGPQNFCGRGYSEGKLSFHRFGRGLKDNFIRFGRAGDSFIRFGRGGGKEGFIRFGKALPNDFFRAGKSLRENFIRFGKSDENFAKLDRENTDEYRQDFFSSEKPYQRADKFSTSGDDFLRFKKSDKNGTNFLRFGKSNAESDGDADEFGEVLNRKRRNAHETPPSKGIKSKRKRSTRFFEVSPDDFLKGISSKQNLENSLTPFFLIRSNIPKSFDYYESETKRNQGGSSNFIRFG